MYDKFGQFIDGKWQKSSSGETYDVINPATEEVVGKASKANSEDIQKALKSAEKGLKIWKNTSPWERAKIIRKISELMREKVDVLSKWMTLEVGKPLTEGAGEIGGACRFWVNPEYIGSLDNSIPWELGVWIPDSTSATK